MAGPSLDATAAARQRAEQHGAMTIQDRHDDLAAHSLR
jgi:hypothetical protein